jgi:eukaryotic-like serine/threonine-protein kinase
MNLVNRSLYDPVASTAAEHDEASFTLCSPSGQVRPTRELPAAGALPSGAPDPSGEDNDRTAPLQRDALPIPPTAPQIAARLAEAERRVADCHGRGTSIGRYLVLNLLGQGGMGSVYAAYDPDLDRRVALKLLHTARASLDDRKRLVREARALAQLSHPNVVHAYDVGVHEGNVFMAMELVEGTSLKEWCEGEPRPSWREVLNAYLDAARGLSASHAVGLVHRDVKPSNILRGSDGRVRVVDFGLVAASRRDARRSEREANDLESSGPCSSLEGRLDESLTEVGVIMGTPSFMAPEQHLSTEVGPAADQFSLCASLYQGLYGQRAFEPRDTGSLRFDLHEVVEQLLERKYLGEVAPPPADTRVPAWVHQALLRGLAPLPEARHPSMDALIVALTAEPEPHPQSRLRRTGAAALLVTLVAAAVVGLGRSGAFRDPCRDPGGELAGVWDPAVGRAVSDAFTATGQPGAADAEGRVRAALDAHAGAWLRMKSEICRARAAGDADPRVLDLREGCLQRRRTQLRAFTEILAAGPDIGVVEQAIPMTHNLYPIDYCADVQALTARMAPPEDPGLRARVEAISPRAERLEALLHAGKYRQGVAESEPLLAETATLRFPPLRAQVMRAAGRLRERAGDLAGAKAMLQGALLEAARAKDDQLLANAWLDLWFVVSSGEARLVEAEAMRSAIAIAVERADDDPIRAKWLGYEADMLKDKGELERARVALSRAIEMKEKARGADPIDLAGTLNSLGTLLQDMGEYQESAAQYERALALFEQAYGPEHPHVAQVLNNLSDTLRLSGRHEESMSLLERALAIRERALGPNHALVGQSIFNLGELQMALGRPDLARGSFERADESFEKALGREHLYLTYSRSGLGRSMAALGELAPAVALLEGALAQRERLLGPDHALVAASQVELGTALARTGEHARARALHERAIPIAEMRLGPEHPEVAEARAALGAVLVELGQLNTARAELERALSRLEEKLGPANPRLTPALLGLGELELALRRPTVAVPWLERALSLSDGGSRAAVQLALARALWARGGSAPRARALARAASDHHESIGNRVELGKVKRWLKEHGLSGSAAREP